MRDGSVMIASRNSARSMSAVGMWLESPSFKVAPMPLSSSVLSSCATNEELNTECETKTLSPDGGLCTLRIIGFVHMSSAEGDDDCGPTHWPWIPKYRSFSPSVVSGGIAMESRILTEAPGPKSLRTVVEIHSF